MEDIVHKALECLGRIAEAKGHGKVFIEAKRSDDSCFGDVKGVDGDLVVTFDEV